MKSKKNQSEIIHDAVKEQLGIEEDEYYDFEEDYLQPVESSKSNLVTLQNQISILKDELEVKKRRITVLEAQMYKETKRIDRLERKVGNLENGNFDI